MTGSYYEQMKQCSVIILLRAVVDAEGNQCEAAINVGIHRNTFNRILHEAGWNSKRLKALAEEHNPVLKAKAAIRKKPVQSELFGTARRSVCA